MIKKILLILTLINLIACNSQKKIDHHGVHLLKKKSENIVVNKTNKNEIIKLLGPSLIKSNFNNDLHIYIERKITVGKLSNLGKQKMLANNVLILEINSRGIVVKKDFYDLKEMNDLELVSSTTNVEYTKKNFIYDFLSSMRQKVNDPLGKRKRD